MIQRNTLLLIVCVNICSLNVIASQLDFVAKSAAAVKKIQSRNQLSREIINLEIKQARLEAEFDSKRSCAIKILQSAIDEAEEDVKEERAREESALKQALMRVEFAVNEELMRAEATAKQERMHAFINIWLYEIKQPLNSEVKKLINQTSSRI